MDMREGSRSRNNKLIFITAGVIFVLSIFSLQTQPGGKVVKIDVGDSSFQVVNMLSREGVAFKILPVDEGEGVVVDYTPVSPLERLNKKYSGSRYEVHFIENRVARIVWRDKDNRHVGNLLSVKIVAKQ
ncbi:MAG: hypothetical protein KKD73_00390 [Proteobacteria bacterium]|nr:hypothetical protein [Pseudomonadota bacterium]MBU1639139.1 hypothetical protein [Pseudomonadota bacterium]